MGAVVIPVLVIPVLIIAVSAASPTRWSSTTYAAPATAAYVPAGPHRLADTRAVECGCTRIDATTVRVRVGGRAGIDPGITAAALTVTATRVGGDGHVTLFPTGAPLPEASTLNLRHGADTANSAIVPVGADGSVDLVATVPTELVVDVTGVFVPRATARAGRFVPVPPTRVADTRDGAPLAPDGNLDIARPVGVDADASALVLNVTSVDARRAGFMSAGPPDAPPPTSFLNPDGSGGPRAASVIVPASSEGVRIGSTAGGHVVVDLVGWFTGPSAADSDAGLFVPLGPVRVLDTRGDGGRLWPGGTRELAVPVTGAAAVVTNVTLDRTDDAGFVTAYPAGTPQPSTSSVNTVTRDDTVPNLAVTSLSARGVAYFSDRGTDLIVDVTGFFTGTPVAAPLPPPPNVRPPSRVLLVGDSTMAALRYITGSQTALQGFAPLIDTEPCRRLVFPSCLSNTTSRIPNTAYEAITGTPGWVDAVVVMTGYNDWFDDFGAAFDTIVTAARDRGARRVVWLTYVEGGDSPTALRAYRKNNVDLRAVAAEPGYGDVTIADWNTYSARAGDWLGPDGIHLSTRGAFGLGDYLSRWIARLEGRPCPQPWRTPSGVDVASPEVTSTTAPCADPDASGAVADVAGLYGI